MSETRFCELCHEQVWFGAYGTTKNHVNYTPNPYYESREKVCVDCIETLKTLPISRPEENDCKCGCHPSGEPCDECNCGKDGKPQLPVDGESHE